jgi:L-fuconolactonase
MTKTTVVDSHQHFWRTPTVEEYPWITDELAAIRHAFGPEDLRPLLAETGVDHTVVVQTRSSLQETRDFLALAAGTDFIAGVVGWIDLTDPAAGATIEELRAGPGGQYLVGIRHQVHDEPEASWLLRDDVGRGLHAIQEANLAYDLLVRTRELPAACEVARRFPHLRLVVDHIAKPPIAAGEIDTWAEAMAPLSEFDNVGCKLSGMVTEANWSSWSAGDLMPYTERVLHWFGPDRLLFGSDWPVCMLAASYRQVVDTCREVLAGVPEEARQNIFGGNAIRFYQLDVPAIQSMSES